jgi:hypothetical protein
MNVKKFGTALVVILALGAVMASSAFAAAEEKAAPWQVFKEIKEEKEVFAPLAESETVSSTGSGELVTTVGETPLVLKSTGLECLECKIENSGGKSIGTGKLKFTGVTVSSPATCAVSGGAVTTLALKVNAGFMGGAGSGNTVLFQPSSGSTFATVTLKEGSGSCPLSGSYIVSGKVFVRSNNSTGTYAVSQTVTSSGAINAEGGGELKFGSKAAELNGTGTFSLSGKRSGQKFGTHE